MIRYALLVFLALNVTLSGSAQAPALPGSAQTLKGTFKNDFLIGAAINTRQIEEKDTAAARLIPQQFNALTPENCMKAEIINPGWDKYSFDLADKLVAYAKKNNIKVNAHNLIWHSQLPGFVRQLQNADSLRTWFTNHITTIASRYDNKVYSWDVVNEALNEDGTLRNSIFLQKLGPDYLVEAFRLAQKAAPHTKLYYNDYNIEQPKKRAGAIALIKKIQAAGVRIDGVGIQGHWRANNVPLADVEASIKEFSALGIEVMFTELDLSVLPNPRDHSTADIGQTAANKAGMNPYTNGLPDSAQDLLAKSYADLFHLFLQYKGKVTRITFWGIDDGMSWLNGFPIRGRTDYPLPFDRNYQPKKAYFSILATKQQP
jgi:endo-1,4-beta-xylanase